MWPLRDFIHPLSRTTLCGFSAAFLAHFEHDVGVGGNEKRKRWDFWRQEKFVRKPLDTVRKMCDTIATVNKRTKQVVWTQRSERAAMPDLLSDAVTLTIEEWKAEEANCLSSSFLSTLFLPWAGRKRINLRIKSSNNNNVTWSWSQLNMLFRASWMGCVI